MIKRSRSSRIACPDEVLPRFDAFLTRKGLHGIWLLEGLDAKGNLRIETTRPRQANDMPPVRIALTGEHLREAGVKVVFLGARPHLQLIETPDT